MSKKRKRRERLCEKGTQSGEEEEEAVEGVLGEGGACPDVFM